MNELAVLRTGGFGGLRVSGTVGVPDADSLRERLAALPPHTPRPDRFVYELSLDDTRVTVGEQDLPDDLRVLVEKALTPAG